MVICAAYRAIPILVFSDEDISLKWGEKRRDKAEDVNLTVERAGCFIFSQQESAIRVKGGQYVMADAIEHTQVPEQIAFSGLRKDLLSRSALPANNTLDLVDLYGASGCLTPALSFAWLKQHADFSGRLRTIVPDKQFGYSYFDIEYCKE